MGRRARDRHGSIAGAIVQAHGGTIEVDSVQDVGTTFRVRMPMVV